MTQSEPPPSFAAALADTPAQSNHDHVPSYDDTADIWQQWDAADKASQTVLESQEELGTLEPRLKTLVKEHAKLKQTSTTLFEQVHRKGNPTYSQRFKRLGSVISSSSNTSEDTKASKLQENFENAYRQETEAMGEIERLRMRISTLKKTIEECIMLASQADQTYQLLSAHAAALHLQDIPAVKELECQLIDASASVEEAQKKSIDFDRARVTVQHAHHYYTNVLETLDSVRSISLNRFVLGGIGNVSGYRIAADTSVKAQTCFNETVRVLQPYNSEIPSNLFEEYEKLQTMGLSQASKIYKLIFGWKQSTSGLSKSIKLMVERQEIVFASLTRMAIWVQDNVPVAEENLRSIVAAHNALRRRLVATWKHYATLERPSQSP